MRKRDTKSNQETKTKTSGNYGCYWYDLTGDKEAILHFFDKG